MTAVAPIAAVSSNLLVASLASPQPVDASAPASQAHYRAFELDNAAILAAALGLGVYVDYRA